MFIERQAPGEDRTMLSEEEHTIILLDHAWALIASEGGRGASLWALAR